MAEENTIVIDATGMIVGRLATRAAREAMHGKQVRIINAEKAVFSGRKRMVIEQWTRKFGMGVARKGPFTDRQPDKFLRRIIRGMLPHKITRGREAYKSVLCYIGTPKEFASAKAVRYEDASHEKLPIARHITVGALCKELGGKWHE